jgi:acetylornithine deacetylase/succinyl-diaminopimelate desuccinylase-like protein
MTRPPMDIGADHDLVQALCTAVASTGRPATITTASYWTDAALHVAAGTPAVVFGPTGEGLHEICEWVTTDSLDRCTASLRHLVRSWCA